MSVLNSVHLRLYKVSQLNILKLWYLRLHYGTPIQQPIACPATTRQTLNAKWKLFLLLKEKN